MLSSYGIRHFQFLIHLLELHDDVTTASPPQQPLEGWDFPWMDNTSYKTEKTKEV